MYITHHFKTRRSQRGISAGMTEAALAYGHEDPNRADRLVLNQRDAEELIKQSQYQIRLQESALRAERARLRELKKLADKGGIVVVRADLTCVTTYNLEN